ncbi:MAG: hypothetical protein WD009_05960 [Phycisphaeraceae bacterium]
MPLRWVGLIVFVLLILFTVPVLQMIADREPPELATLTTLELPDDRAMQIRGRLLRDRTQAYYYTVLDAGGAAVEADAFFGSHPPGTAVPELTVHVAEEGAMIAVTAAAAPQGVLILHDFETGASWPAKLGPYEPVEHWSDRGRALLARFNAARADGEALRLYEGEGMRPLPMPE